MTPATVRVVDVGQADETAPPPGTAVVRPLRHFLAVRERDARRYTDPAEAVASRSARAWAWALGESDIAPVTDLTTAVPPSRSDIEAEIKVADERRARGDRENRADAAAAILSWLIGDDDHVPVRGENCGELVGGFGDVVRSREQIATVLTVAVDGRVRAAVSTRDLDASPEDRQFAQRHADYLDGVAATLAWVLGERPEAPITHTRSREPTTRDLKAERVHAEDVIGQAKRPWFTEPTSTWYGEGVNHSIDWLLGDSSTCPLTQSGTSAAPKLMDSPARPALRNTKRQAGRTNLGYQPNSTPPSA